MWCSSVVYEVRQFNSWNSCSVSLGCWVRQTHVLKHVWTCFNLRLHEPQTKWVVRSRAAECPWYTVGGKMSDKNLEQRMNIKFCVKIGKSASETLALLTVAYGEYTMKKLSVFEWHRQFKEGLEDVQDDSRSGQSKTQGTNANVDRVRTLVCSNRRLGVRVIAGGLNMNRETVWEIVKEDLGMRKISEKWCLESWHMTRSNVSFTFHLIYYAMQKWLIGSLPVMKRGVFNTTPKKKRRQSMQWKTQNSPRPKKSTHVLVTGPDHACVFLRSQSDSLLWIRCTRTNGKSTVLFGNGDKVMGICSEEKTQALAW